MTDEVLFSGAKYVGMRQGCLRVVDLISAAPDKTVEIQYLESALVASERITVRYKAIGCASPLGNATVRAKQIAMFAYWRADETLSSKKWRKELLRMMRKSQELGQLIVNMTDVFIPIDEKRNELAVILGSDVYVVPDSTSEWMRTLHV